jgi:hypothetical protein
MSTDTPTTNAFAKHREVCEYAPSWREFAEALERDLAAAQLTIARQQQELDASCNAEELRQVRAALERAQKERDQWRDLCTTFAHLRRHGDYGGSFSALARFDALVKGEK